jgi:uncharacterized protein YggE
MNSIQTIAVLAAFAGCFSAVAQQVSQPQLKIDSANRTLTVSADGDVTAEPEIAVLHIGFDHPARRCKIGPLRRRANFECHPRRTQAGGIAESDIRSASQFLDRDDTKPHKFKLTQKWTVKTTPQHAAEMLDVAITAGATSSGQIDWKVKDESALEEQALDRASTRAKENATTLAKSMGVRLGALIFVSNQLSSPGYPRPMAMARSAEQAQPLAIEPQKVSRSATVCAVYAIE